MQENWFNLIKQCGSEKAAQKYLAALLRQYVDQIEANKYPRVFGFEESKKGPFERITVTLSYPWGG